MKPTHLDLFSGIGGFTLAAQEAGFETIGFSEIEPYACKILKQHWPDITNYGDVRTIPTVRCDFITGGFPCQPFSLAGKRGGASDDRFLWPAMLDVIRRCRPAWVLGENVPGLIGMELDRCLTDLEGIGFRTITFVIPACAVDARHRRDRVWIVAYSERGWRREQLRTDAQWQSLLETIGPQGASGVRSSSETVANAMQSGLQNSASRELGGISEKTGSSTRCKSCGTTSTEWRNWPTEPEVGRVAHGIPNRSHRLKGLGNAIVPQVAQVILQAIRAALT